jgi:integrase
MNYPTNDGKYGPIYSIAEGVKVMVTDRNRWQLVVCHGGQRDRRNFEAGNEGLKKALQAGELYAAKIGLKTSGDKELVTVSQVAEEYLKCNRSRWAYETYERYYSIIQNHINPVIGSIPIQKVGRNRVREMLAEILAIRTSKTVELIHSVVSGIFTEAIEGGATNENPTAGLLKRLLPPKHKRNESTPDPFTKEDLGKMLVTAWRHLNPVLALILETAAYSGMRLGECLAMHCDQLDISNLQYMVSETVKNGRFGSPKTGKRLIDLPGSLVTKLETHIKVLRKEGLRQGKNVTYLFPGITQRMVQGAIKRACRMAKLRARSPHDLRHTYATILLMEHYSPAYVQKQLGHHSITMTVDIYGHWIPGEGRKDLERALLCVNPEKATGILPGLRRIK